MQTLILLILVTLCYSAYNLLVKVSTSHIQSLQTPPILATIFLQSCALAVSLVYLFFLTRQPVNLTLPPKAYVWAALAGICIGVAEVLYFYLFRGFSEEGPVPASSAIPFIVGGTIVVAIAVSHFIFRETLNAGQWAGVGLAFAGMIVIALNSA